MLPVTGDPGEVYFDIAFNPLLREALCEITIDTALFSSTNFGELYVFFTSPYYKPVISNVKYNFS